VFRETATAARSDLIFFTFHKILWHFFFVSVIADLLSRGIVVRMLTAPATLEAGSLSPDNVHVVEIEPRLTRTMDVWGARLHHPLTAEQAAKVDRVLPSFRLAAVRQDPLGLEGVSGRTLSVLRYRVFGPPPINRRSWYCSELIICRRDSYRPAPYTFSGPRMLFPHDLFSDCPARSLHVGESRSS